MTTDRVNSEVDNCFEMKTELQTGYRQVTDGLQTVARPSLNYSGLQAAIAASLGLPDGRKPRLRCLRRSRC